MYTVCSVPCTAYFFSYISILRYKNRFGTHKPASTLQGEPLEKLFSHNMHLSTRELDFPTEKTALDRVKMKKKCYKKWFPNRCFEFVKNLCFFRLFQATLWRARQRLQCPCPRKYNFLSILLVFFLFLLSIVGVVFNAPLRFGHFYWHLKFFFSIF